MKNFEKKEYKETNSCPISIESVLIRSKNLHIEYQLDIFYGYTLINKKNTNSTKYILY